MKIEQIYTGCLAQGAYYITSNGEAAIIDPLRELQPYLDRFHNDNVKLKYIFETHFHADFVSGHHDLSNATGAKIVFGPNAEPDFEIISAIDNQEFNIGKIKIKVLHTPGHTMESTTYLLIDENNKDYAIFSGDTLFIGDVGRPDLAQKSATLTQEQLAGMLFHSLRNKIMILEDHVLVYPAHGAGSACGKNMSKETFSTIGEQKTSNYALRANMTETEFIDEVLDGLMPPPDYFGMNVAMNKRGIDSFKTIFNKALKPINLVDFEKIIQDSNVLILDTRKNTDFALGFIPNSINIGINGDFAPWVGTIIANVKQPIILVTDVGLEKETITRLARVGFDNLLGFLDGGFNTWLNADLKINKINRITANQFEKQVNVDFDKIIDVRKMSEYQANHVSAAFNKPLSSIKDWIKNINPNEPFYIYCAGGYRSMIAASILQKQGFNNFIEIEGGFNAIANTTISKTDFVCQSKL
jgi:hydroxyacylglutathione hydrolase